MASETQPNTERESSEEAVELPRPTVAPLVAAVGVALVGLGFATAPTIAVPGVILILIGIGMWVGELLPGRGHHREPIPASSGPAPLQPRPTDSVERLREGTPGFRMRMPEDRHPISAGLRGGIAGGFVMPIPALAYGVVSGHGIWYPVNLLAGIMLPGVGAMTVEELERFHIGLFLVAVVLHVVMSVVIGLLYGVLMPTLPSIPKAMAWGGVLMPILWTVITYGSMAIVNPLLNREVDWPWFILSQFIFGVVVALTYMGFHDRYGSLVSGLVGGIIGGLLMPIPAVLWSVSQGNGIWFPANLLAGMIVTNLDDYSHAELVEYRPQWLIAAIAIHGVMTLALGILYGLVLPRLKPIAGPLVWGGLLLPLLWTASSFGLMGVVNPVLQERVDWPWFVASQFVFGIVAAVIVVRSEKIIVPPAGSGPDVVRRSI